MVVEEVEDILGLAVGRPLFVQLAAEVCRCWVVWPFIGIVGLSDRLSGLSECRTPFPDIHGRA